jgi:MoxR-like ATPase
LDPVDLRGLPVVSGDRARWIAPDFLPRAAEPGGDSRGILFLDELAQAPLSVQNACLQLTLDRRIGEYVLPDGWSIVAASNRVEDRAGAGRITSALSGRFIHLDYDVDADDWQKWALTAGIAPEVRAFLRYRPALLFSFDPKQASARAFASPRSWQFVSQIFATLPDEVRLPTVQGTVGEGPAAEFLAFVRIYRDLPDPRAIVAAPDTSPVPGEPSVLYALCGALAETARTAAANTLDAIAKYLTRLPAEFAVVAMRDALAVQPAILTQPSAKTFLAKHRATILA